MTIKDYTRQTAGCMRWFAHMNRKEYRITWLALCGILTAIGWTTSYGIIHAEINMETPSQDIHTIFAGNMMFVYIGSIFLLLPLVTAMTFGAFNRRDTALHALMLPADPGVKYAALWLTALLATPIICISAAVAADVLQWLFILCVQRQFGELLILASLRVLFETPSAAFSFSDLWEKIFIAIGVIWLAAAIMVCTQLLFKRYRIISGILSFLLVVWGLSHINRILFPAFQEYSTAAHCAVLFLLAGLFTLLGSRLLRRHSLHSESVRWELPLFRRNKAE